jgi:hypothetical protein
MKIKINYLISMLLMVGLFSSCQKQEMFKMVADPTAPEITTMPNLTLARSNASDTLTFSGTSVNPGFQASATYYLEACPTGDNFANPISLMNSNSDKAMKITVSALNTLLLKVFPADTSSSIDFRIRAVLAVDAGTGAPGVGSKAFAYSSKTVTKSVTIYGLPRLDLMGSGMTQKIVSAAGDGSYFGFVKIDPAKPFKLYDPDNDTTYGASGGNLVANGGSGIVASGDAGWYQLSANINTLKYSMNTYMIGLVGSATPNGWNSPDQKMDYDAQSGTWSITIDLVVGQIKFRMNDGWSWNLGYNASNHSLNDLVYNGDNIDITSAGNYTITLNITKDSPASDATGTCTIVKNN